MYHLLKVIKSIINKNFKFYNNLQTKNTMLHSNNDMLFKNKKWEHIKKYVQRFY